ncbi:universal stress protein [Nocardioides psychrotolerans]|uniref:Nucleotide-binding universal stress protein, UspA family n=1 Tax=Nocardioides psychrotolerans TaxID=1005945 RepID=A0A1I3JVH6_9ACTN|nr:universal stress protein [Nocardioides psychrotolerans]SFI64279.1 Nucleotide-binding universal stress protein, UspA family [Nocardioides psychrotolerans]
MLVGTDGSLIADAAVRWAATEAGRRVAPTAEAAGPGPTVETSLAVGAANTRLVAATQEAQLLVVGNRGLGGFGSLLLGSVSSSVVTHAACPTVVVRGETQSQGPVVVGVDEVGASRPAIEAAFAAAQRVGVGVLAVHAYRSPGPLAIREEMASDVMTGEVSVARENYPEEQVRTHLARRSPVHELVEASQGAQVVVTGASGSGGFASHGIGSTSVTVIRHAHCPVLVQR